MSSIFFTSLSIALMDTELITRRLKAAEPTIVDGPKSPASLPKSLSASNTERMISGAEEPKAISVKFAMVAFHTGTSISKRFSVFSSTISIFYVLEVIISMASIKISALIEIPRNKYPRNTRYTGPISPTGSRDTPGLLIMPEKHL